MLLWEVKYNVFFAWAVFPFAALRVVAASREEAAWLSGPIGDFELLSVDFGDGEFYFELFFYDLAVCGEFFLVLRGQVGFLGFLALNVGCYLGEVDVLVNRRVGVAYICGGVIFDFVEVLLCECA